MAHRRLLSLLLRRNEVLRRFQQQPQQISWTLPQPAGHLCPRSQRALRTGTPLMMKLLSVDELFASKSLQEYLQRMQKEYDECLRVVGGNVSEEECREAEMKTKRTKVSLLAPLIQSVRELHAKQQQITETEALLKGEQFLKRVDLACDVPILYFFTFIQMKTQRCENWLRWREKSVCKIFKI